MKKSTKNILIITSSVALLIVPFFIYLFLPNFLRYITGINISYDKVTISQINDIHLYNQEIDIRASKVYMTNPLAFFSSRYETDILINEPVIVLTSTSNKVTELDFIKRLPKVRNLVIEKGTLLYSKKGLPYQLSISSLKIFVKNYEPNRGGDMEYDFLFDVNDMESKSSLIKGKLTGKLKLNHHQRDITSKGDFSLDMDYIDIGKAYISEGNLTSNVSYDRKVLRLNDVTLSSKGLLIKEPEIRLQDLSVRFDLFFDLDSAILSISNIKGSLNPLGEYAGNLTVNTLQDYSFHTNMALKEVNIKRLYQLLRPLIKEDLAKLWELDGQCSTQLALQGYFKDSIPYVVGSARIDIKDGSFSSDDSMKAGQGIKGSIDLELTHIQTLKKNSLIHLQNKIIINQGEYLYNNFYLNHKEIPLRLDLKIASDMQSLTSLELQTDLFETADYEFKVSFIDDKIDVKGRIKSLHLDRFYDNILKVSLDSIYPSTKEMVVKGKTNFTIDGSISNIGFQYATYIDLSEGYVNLPILGFTIKDLQVKTPFYVNQRVEQEEAFLNFSELDYRGLQIKDIKIPLSVEKNKLSLNNPFSFDFLQGSATLQKLDISVNTNEEFNLKTSLDVKDAKTSLLTEILGLGSFGGNLDAKITELEFKGGNIFSDSILQADVFGGQVEVTNFHGNINLKTYEADIKFKDIDLERLTETIKIGKITGIVDGSLMDFQIQYGQAARFILDIDSVKKDGIRQSVSTDAVESISILGTGAEGISRLLSTGINQFFKEFPYSKIGIKCILNNDVFTIRGKILEGGREYLIRKGFLRGIDVVNQNPDNQISFKDMQKRLNIIFEQGSKG